jgi:hypothetical protein
MLQCLLPVLATLSGAPAPAPTSAPDAAQLRLAEALADADSVDWVRVDRAHRTVTFGIERAGESYEILASEAPDGEVTQVRTADTGRGSRALGGLSWLADAMHRQSAIRRLEIGDDGAVTVVTGDGTRYVVTNNPADLGRAWNGA